MGNKSRSRGREDEEYLRSVWEWAQELEVTSGCKCQVALTRNPQPGTWLVQVKLFDLRRAEGPRLVHSITGSFPNSRSTTLGGYLMALMMKVDRMVADGIGSSEQQDTGLAPGAD